MKFIIIGSGGCASIPKVLCQCHVCIEARKKGFPYARCGCSLYFVFESNGKKVIYAPCDCKNFPTDDIIYDSNMLIIGCTFAGDILKNNTKITPEHNLRKELHSIEDIIEIKNKFKIKEVVITHIEEFGGKSYDEYKELEKQYANIKFAYDGMRIDI